MTCKRMACLPLLVLLAAALLLAACGRGGADGAAAPNNPAPAAPVPTATDAATVTPPATLPPEWAPTPTPAPPVRAPAAGELYVDTALSRGPINPLVYGATTGPLWPVRPEVMPLAEAVGLNILSFPGGEYGDTRDLQQFEIDNFIDLSRRLGAEPLIHVRLPGGSPEKAVAMLEYANKTQGYGVKYWAIGNEPDLYAPRHTDFPWNPQTVAQEWRKIALAMKEADPSILLVGPEIGNFAGTLDVRDWELEKVAYLEEFLRLNADLVDIVSIHRYPFPADAGNPVTTPLDDLRTNPREWDSRIIPDLRELMREVAGREFPIAVTEVNSHWSKIIRRDTSPDSLANAIWWGDVLMRMIRQKVDIVTFWSLVTGSDQGGWGMLDRYEERPVYHTFVLFSRFGQELLHAASGNEEVNVIAARRADGALTLMISNMSLEPQMVTLTLDNAGEGGTMEAWRIDAEHLGDALDAETVAGGGELTLPPLSLTLYVLE